MKFEEFLEHYNSTQLIDSSTFRLFSSKPNDLRRQVRFWLKKGYLVKLKRGIYVFNEKFRKKEPSTLFVANFLVVPSYISLEYALGYYSLIPEKVTTYTSVTTKKTRLFKNNLGIFTYNSVKNNLFFGYKNEIDKNQSIFVAEPEKAILDFFYFRKDIKGDFEEFESFRFQNLEIINCKRLKSFSLKYNKKVVSIALKFTKFVKQEKASYKVLK